MSILKMNNVIYGEELLRAIPPDGFLIDIDLKDVPKIL